MFWGAKRFSISSGSFSRADLFFSLILALFFFSAQEAAAVRPLYAPVMTVAGDELQLGYRDGSFNTARFHTPLGLAINQDGTQLFVADSGNNRIRVIHLDQNNEVTTLAGQASAGSADGPLTMAQFNSPRGVLYLSDDRLVVNDFGNHDFRIVDLKAGAVSTFQGKDGGPDGAKPSSAAVNLPALGLLVNVQAMAYMAEADSVFYTQPETGTLKRWDLKTGIVTTVLNNNVLIPHPGAVHCQGVTLYIADRDLPKVYETVWKNDVVTSLDVAGNPLDKVISLCSSDNILYGLLAKNGFPLERFMVDKRYSHVDRSNQLVELLNSWGDTVPQEKYFPTEAGSLSPWMGLVADPNDTRKFYLCQSDFQMIVGVRDLFTNGGYNSNDILAREYPAKKPPKTYRIFVVGDSRSLEAQPFPFVTGSHPITNPPNIPFFNDDLILSPQIERALNFQAALEDVPLNYEVLTFGRHGDLIFWPSLDVPPAVKKNDVDLVIIFSPNLDRKAYTYYFDHPLTSDGIPQYPTDPEYLLKPAQDRIPSGLPKKFYEYCKAHGFVKIDGKKFVFDDDKIMSDPQLHDWVLEFYGRPWAVLQKKLSGMKTSEGKPVRLLVLLTYTGRMGSQLYHPDFYQEVATKYGIPFYDLGPIMNALHLSYYPLTGDQTHLNPDGCIFFGRLLAHQLIQEKLIPWKEGTGPEKP
jgi:hypothetical protein